MANDAGGVWRTVGGRRIFIKDGQDLSSAMKESGKFSKGKTNKENKNRYSDEQIKEVWKNEDATEVYNYLTASERNKLDRAYEDAELGNKSAQEYIDKTERKAAEKFLEANKKNQNKESLKESSSIKSQQLDIEKATGSKVEEAFESDLYGNGKEDRFVLSDGRMITHTKESFGEKEDRWIVYKNSSDLKGKSYDSYDAMKKDLGGSEKSNSAYKKAFAEYMKKHPNSKLTLQKFINMSEGK